MPKTPVFSDNEIVIFEPIKQKKLMKDLKNLSKQEKDLLISIYELGWQDGEAGLAMYNNLITNEEKIEYLDAILNPEGIDIELIDSVS